MQVIDYAFNDIERKDLPEKPEGIGGAQYLDNLSALQIGFGSKVFRGDRSGIWLGAEKFADAPFSVDMLGNVIASSATFSAYSKIHIFKQTAIPTSLAIGDVWFDTDDNNKPYIADSVGADEITAGEWVLVNDLRAADALLKTGASQTLSGDFNLNDANVKIDGTNKRILINDGTNDRILIGYQSGGF